MVIFIRKNPITAIAAAIILIFGIWLAFIPNNSDVATVYGEGDIINVDIAINVIYMVEDDTRSSPLYIAIKDARIIIIDDRTGKIIKSGLTNEKGAWLSNINVIRDPRFEPRIGSITVIAVANGYNEVICFNTPVNEHTSTMSGANIIMNPVRPGGRNEPSFENARFHRFTVFKMLDKYANEIGLTRQALIRKGETPPWGPTLKN